MPAGVAAQSQPGMGNNAGTLRIEAAAYRAHVRTMVGHLLDNLGGLWDDSRAAEPARFYAPNATMALGPDQVIEGRKQIQAAFAEKLGKMRGVQFAIDEFDLGDELAFVRGTMRYELIRSDNVVTNEVAAFAMSLRVRNDQWLIRSHVIGGKPVLADDSPP